MAKSDRGMEAKSVGAAGEEIAAAYLKRSGYRILGRNAVFRGRRQLGELDIVAQKGGEVVFVEVKAGSSKKAAYRPEIHVTATKAHRLRRAAQAWLQANKKTGAPCRIDVIAVDFRRDEIPHVRHFCHAVMRE